MGEYGITWSRAEVRAVREAVELTPNFEGRLGVRDTFATRSPGKEAEVVFEREVAERFARRLVATDLPTALAKVKLLRAIREADSQARTSSPRATHRLQRRRSPQPYTDLPAGFRSGRTGRP